MRRALILAAALTVGCAAPAFAQHSGHTTAPAAAPATTTAPGVAADPSCPPEHAAMGHCKPEPGAADPVATSAPAPDPRPDQSSSIAAPTATVDPSCPPEHAAMGHCTPKEAPGVQPAPIAPARAAKPTPALPASVDASCPPEHAAMGHCTPAAPVATPDKPRAQNMGNGSAAAPTMAAETSCSPEHAAMGHCTPKSGASAVAPPVAPPPQAAFGGPEHAADMVWDPALMAEKRADGLLREHGGYTGYMVLFDQFEYRAVEGRDGYFVNAQAWYGGDYDRLWIKAEIESDWGRKPEQAEVQALWSRALDPWFNLQTGVRYDFEPSPERAHLVLGIQGLAPYWFEVDGALFLSDEGDLTARLEAEYDQRITQRLILQPRVEIDFALQDVEEIGVGSGLSKIEAGLRLRYEIKREFAPYIGVEYNRTFGDTARFARAENDKVGHLSFVVGLRSWF